MRVFFGAGGSLCSKADASSARHRDRSGVLV